MDKVSIIVPVYKVEKYLDKCVESLVNQTYKNIEIILVDDGSPDNCPAMCDEWAKKDNRIKVIHKENGGVSKAVIDGITNSNGEFLTIIDSDDWISIYFIEKLYTEMNKNDADVAICNYTKVYEDRQEICEEIKQNCLIKKEEMGNFVYIYTGWNNLFISPCRWNKLFKRELVLDSIKYINNDISMGEDINMTFYVLARANKIYLVKENLHFYRQLITSLSNTKRNNWVHYEKLIKQLLLIDEKCKLNLKDYIYDYYASGYINECMKYAIENYNKKQLKEFLDNGFLKQCIKEVPKKNLKRKLYYWALKHKCIPMIKIAVKLLK